MKKGLFMALSFLLLVSSIAGCVNRYEKNTWYSDNKLEECFVPGLPAPAGREYMLEDEKSIYVFMNNSEYDSYVSTIYTYLKEQNFPYLGTRGEQKDTLAGALTTYYFEPAEELADFRSHYGGGDYVFVFSDGSTDEYGEIVFSVLILYRQSAATLNVGRKDFSYNLRIMLNRGSEASAGGFYELKSKE